MELRILQTSYIYVVSGASGQHFLKEVVALLHLQEGAAMPLVATGLLQHEAKLSVLNFAVKKAAAYDGTVANKDELLFVSGVRCGLLPNPDLTATLALLLARA